MLSLMGIARPPAGMRRAGVLAGALVALAALGWSPAARADLAGDAERVERAWRQRGADVERGRPLFLEHGRIRAVATRRPPRPGGEPERCSTVLLLAGRSVDFAIDPLGVDEDAIPRSAGAGAGAPSKSAGIDDGRVRSVSGVATLVRCGSAEAELDSILVEMISGRGAIELLSARSAEPLGALSDILPERAPGPSAPRGDPGPVPEPGPLDERTAAAERRAIADGAHRVAHIVMRASARGAGEFDLRLPEGCHRLLVLADVPTTTPRLATDVDAEAREPTTGRVLARDRAEAPDARLELCVGEATPVEIPYVGASGAVEVAIIDAVWSIPEAVPAAFGARARAGVAGALRRRHAPEPKSRPVLETLGVQGSTTVAVPTEPGRCYLAALGVVRGEARALRLAARLGERFPHDEVSDRPEGAAIAFCSETTDAVALDVEARGSTPWWTLVVWPAGTVRP
jgi:hypothetical protein